MLAFSVIVPTFRRPDILPETLRALASQTIGPKTLEVIVIDDDDSPLTKETAVSVRPLFHSLVYLSQKNEGQSRARNRAIRCASADLLFFMGDDILLAPDALQRHADFHRTCAYTNVAVFGKISTDHRFTKDPFVYWLSNGGPQNHLSSLRASGYIGHEIIETAHLSIRRHHATAILFDERIRYYENSIWARALFDSGFLFYFLAEAASYHFHPATLESYGQRMRNMGKAIALMEQEGLERFKALAVRIRRIGKARMLRYKIMHVLRNNPKTTQKYWALYLDQCLYRGYTEARDVLQHET
ncbi:MAG: hypothetical protein A2487_02440 [Candidatus Raymondbacteria bacterium RifOxyC12_full_50_8]|uniref:Glycosyltransferase 2-like domain-containing protein n=1 Tax=Candidatus Raymondbacteria bacterium RIFOXYD12_FULL_49_13 TaxID=1817890 RepID=A0A1F7FHS0_UNCRA|nr:MAG: hypothetical protein A2248_20985 [Candidatus Raymondbacteria bacterium RIFOXYA2_FULL_49_16]OGJ99536.1 MAG: hypothetical protein A2350_05550 [Candidatus Raymondbacteria bacterium RifOxyB12_full_50_8]OGK06265.1 MAG: hypothetical protein A2519_08300 [Candidatus Raymondbacteria bacterium RIFOXYD12_FULL_49_13]OGK07721.1 MAG: hypothetical protein A2487_02440 [Candidatus Raymondbacteria bacterium RifOxyC12_full_50_8]OGP40597.1 MAG: hypothetical protein A2324_03055 [Candidatus Raymondbacteria b